MGEEEELTCEDTRLVKITFTNTSDKPLRVVVAPRLTPQYVPVDPIITEDLAAGATVVKEILAERYVITWYKNCSTTCAVQAQPFRTYETCTNYDEKP
jgi:hypothetical protein